MDVRACTKYPGACLGGASDTCKAGLTGPFCALCVNASKYFDEDDEMCYDCERANHPGHITALVLVALGVVALLYIRKRYWTRWASFEAHMTRWRVRLSLHSRCKILITTFQILVSFGAVYQLSLPPDVQQVLGYFDALTVNINVPRAV